MMDFATAGLINCVHTMGFKNYALLIGFAAIINSKRKREKKRLKTAEKKEKKKANFSVLE
jgi:hypothetical protein